MVINTNVEAQSTANHLNASQIQLAKSLARLSSGSKIIVPSDDAAGLAVSSRLNSQVKRLDSALNNVVNAVSFTQTQDGFMKTIDKAFRRMGELAMLAQDTTKSDEDRALYNQEFEQLKEYVAETAKQDFNGVSLFAGKTLDVTVDSDGTTFSMIGIDLAANTYNSAINNGTESWRLDSDAYRLSKDGYQLKTAASKTSIDLWRDGAGTWSAGNNGGVKFAAGSIVSDTITTAVDAGVIALATNSYVSKTVTLTGFTTDYLANKLTKAGHGLVTGNKIKLPSGAPNGTTSATEYYVNVSGNDITLHTTTADATANTSGVNLKASASFNTTLTATAATTDIFTATAHGLADGDKVRITSGAPAGTNTTTTYYAKLEASPDDVNNFTLYTDSALTIVADVTVAGTAISIENNKLTGVSATTGDVFSTVTSHSLATGDIVQATALGGSAGVSANTSYYVKKLTDTTFEVYTTAALTTKVDVTTAGASMRLNVEGSATAVNVENLNNVLKKGNFVTVSPITTGEDAKAVKILKGQDVAINTATQDISSFATRNTAIYYDDVNLKTVTGSQVALDLVKKAITQVATDRAKLGAVQSRLNFTNDQLTVTKENLSAAISRIADVDVAEEATQYARFQILVSSGTEMLKQANQLPQSALTLLR